VLFIIESVFSEGTLVVVCHMFAFAVNTFERVGAWLALGGF